MNESEKNALNKDLCGLLGIEWHKLTEATKYHPAPACSCGTVFCSHYHLKEHIKESNPDFTTDAGKVQLLREMEKRKDYEDFGDLWLLFACWDDKENKVYAVSTKYLIDETGKLAIAARAFLKT